MVILYVNYMSIDRERKSGIWSKRTKVKKPNMWYVEVILFHYTRALEALFTKSKKY